MKHPTRAATAARETQDRQPPKSGKPVTSFGNGGVATNAVGTGAVGE